MIRKLYTAIQLPLDHWVILVKSWVIMLYVRLRMNLTPFRSWKHWLINQTGDIERPLNDNEKSKIVDYRRMVTLASRYHLVNANCLPKSLTLKWMLEKQNIHSELKMGLSTDHSNFHGHAWLERNNTVLNDDQNVASRYPVKQEIEQQPLHIEKTNKL